MIFKQPLSTMLNHGSKQSYYNFAKVALCVLPIFLVGCSSVTSPSLSTEINPSTQGFANLDDERGSGNFRGSKRTQKAISDKFQKPKISKQAFAKVIEAPEEIEAVNTLDTSSNTENLTKVTFVDKTDPKFNEVEPKVNNQTLQGVYAKIATAALNAKKFSNEALLRASEHSLEAHKQDLLPQITPRASVDQNGDTIAQLQVEQILYDSGRYSAGKDILLGEKATASANLRSKENERINSAIAAYIDYHNARATQGLLKKAIKSFRRMESQSESRIYNGVGNSSDRDLFQIKKLEVESEYETQESIALSRNQEFRALTGIAMPSKSPQRIKLPSSITNSPLVELAQAERETVLGNLALQKSNQRPRVSLNGNVGTATDSFDTENMDLRVDVSLSQPLTWGFNHSLAATESEVEASNRKYDEAVKDTQDQLKILRFDLAQSQARHKRLQKLAVNAEKRLKGFNEQFLAGQAGIVEASSTIDSYKKIKQNAIDTEYAIYRTELELATISGLLAQR